MASVPPLQGLGIDCKRCYDDGIDDVADRKFIYLIDMSF